jgi:hypothetical protein
VPRGQEATAMRRIYHYTCWKQEKGVHPAVGTMQGAAGTVGSRGGGEA